MADQKNGGIAWCTKTWNPIRGCSEVSPGCKNCYARTMGARFAGPGMPYEGLIELRRKPGSKRHAEWTGKVRFVRERLADPLRWKKPERIFVNSMSDLFHEALPFEQIAAIFGVMAASPQHTFLVLTKRPERAKAFFKHVFGLESCEETIAREAAYVAGIVWDARATPGSFWAERVKGASTRRPWPGFPLPNVQIGVSVEDQKTADERIPQLFALTHHAAKLFVSYEPALGPIDFTKIGHYAYSGNDYYDATAGLDWIIVGGESGPGARPFDIAWARSTVRQCRGAGVPVFVKQLGSNRIEDGLSDPGHTPGLDRVKHRAGADPNEWPEDLRVQEVPRKGPEP